MTVGDQVNLYLEALPEPKQNDMQRLHRLVMDRNPACKLWFLDGKDESGKVVSNPSIGYGTVSRHYANGASKELFQVGLSANPTGLSVYIMGLDDKKYLQEKYGGSIGKATVTGYCIKFKSLKEAIQDGMQQTRAGHLSRYADSYR